MIGAEGDLVVQRLGQSTTLGAAAAAASSGYSTAQRPISKARRLRSTAAPFSGSRLRWHHASAAAARAASAAQDHHVGIDRIAQRRLGQIGGIEHRHRPSAAPQARASDGRRQLEFGVAGEIAGDDLVAVDHGAGAARAWSGPASCARRHHQIAADQRVASPVATRMALMSPGCSADGNGYAPRRPFGRDRPSPSCPRPCRPAARPAPAPRRWSRRRCRRRR